MEKEPGDEQQPPVHLYEFGLYMLDMLDTTEQRLLYRGRPLKLTDMEFSLLCVLVRSHGRDLSCEDLIKDVWSDTYVKPGDNSPMAARRRKSNLGKLQQQVSHLRKKVGRETIKTTEDEKGYTLGLPVTEIPSPPVSPYVYDDLRFNRWIFLPQKGRPITLALVPGVALTFAYLIFYVLRDPDAGVLGQPIVVLSLIQTVVIAVGVTFSSAIFNRGGKDFRDSGSTLETSVMRACGYDDPEQWAVAKEGAKEALKQYAWFWKSLLGIWCILYLLIFLTACVAPAEGAELPKGKLDLYNGLRIGATLFNNFNTLVLALCYVALNYPTPVDALVPAASNTRLAKIIIIVGSVAILLFTAAECVLVFFPQISGIDNKLIIIVMDVTSGLFGGTALALYVGRIGSKFLNPPDWLIPALYFYAVIQPLYLFIQNVTGGAFIIGGALILKSLLYLYMAWLFKSGRLLFYMVRVRAIYESVNAQWKDFLWNLDKA